MKTGKMRNSFIAAVIINASILAKEQTGFYSVNSETINLFGFQFNTLTELIFCALAVVFVIGLIAVTIEHFTSADKRHKNFLKANIEKLRNEDFQLLVSNDMKKLRSSLIKKAKRNSKSDKIVNAKKYEIATGEIDLAIKLKSLMNN